MRVTFSPLVKNTNIINTNKKQSSYASENNKNIKSLQKHSLAEVLGKTQIISFKGVNSIEGDYIEHTCTEKTAQHGKVTEHIIYNKKSGNYTHRITDKDGGLIRSEEFNPSQEKEVITTYENDIATITTTTPDKTTIEKLDSENRRIYFEERIGDSVKTEVTEYDRGRTVITQKIGDEIIEPITVIDLSTGQAVTEGSLVIDKIYDENNREYITKNIVTNRVHKLEKFDEQGKPINTQEFNPQNGLIIVEKQYKGEYIEDIYTGEEPNRIVSSLFVSSDGREKEFVLYDEDGETVVSHTIYLHRENGSLQQETKLNASQVVVEKIFYGKGESRIHHFYNEKTHVKKSTKEYNKAGTLTTETIYYEDGKTPRLKKEIDKDKSFTIIHYNKDKVETKRNFYDENKNLLCTDIYNVETNSLEKSIEYDLKTGNRTITTYDEEYETPLKQTIVMKDGTIISSMVFYADGKTPQYKREYNSDRSYIDYAFNEKGKQIKTKEYNADGTPKQ